MNTKYIVDLDHDERDTITHDLNGGGEKRVRVLNRMRVLLMADQDNHTDQQIEDALGISLSTIHRVRQRFVEEGLHDAIFDQSRPGAGRKFGAKEEALLVATACTTPPMGRNKWTLKLLADRLVALTDLDSICAETIRKRLKEKQIKPWQKKMWCIKKLDAHFVAQMEHILDLYTEPADPRRPIVNFDETLKQLVGEVRVPIAAKPGQVERYDSHYKRNGASNLFVFFDRHRCWRRVKVTARKTKQDFARCMKELVDVDYPDADVVRVVMDNLSSHSEAALYETFAPEEARRILRRLEFHFTPTHASWLNMVEIEIGVLARQCLDRRIPDAETLQTEVAAWQDARNLEAATIKWLFNLETARTKLNRAYPCLSESHG
jgi:transposase